MRRVKRSRRAQWISWNGFPTTSRLGRVDCERPAGANWFRRLRKLTLEDNLTDESFETLSALPTFRRLHTLDISQNSFSLEAWRTFARSTSFPALAELRLHECDLSGERVEILAGARGFELRALIASWCAIGPGGGSAVAAAAWATSLRILNLSTNFLNATDVKAIVASKNFRSLQQLNLARTEFGPTALSALAANPAAAGIANPRPHQC